MSKKITQMHSIERTSPKGGKFVGVCVLCGEEGLTPADMSRVCPNPEGVTEDEAVLGAINSAPTDGLEGVMAERDALQAKCASMERVVEAVGKWYGGDTKGESIVDAYEEYKKGTGNELRPIPGFAMPPVEVQEQIKAHDSALTGTEEGD